MLLVAIGLGERMGSGVLGQATGQDLQTVTAVAASPTAAASSGPFGPDWKRSDTLSAADDPRFPDPRVPPQPLPTPLPTPKVTATPYVPSTPTPNPNIPIWRQRPLPTATPVVPASASASPSPAEQPSGAERAADTHSPPP